MSDAPLPRQSEPEQIMACFCACSAYPENPGSVVCWKCEQPLTEVDVDSMEGALAQNLLLLCNRYREALEELAANRHSFHRPAGQIAREALDG